MSKTSNPTFLNTSRTINADEKPTKIGWPRPSIIAERNKKLKENFLRSQSLNYPFDNGSSTARNGTQSMLSHDSNQGDNNTSTYFAQPVKITADDGEQHSLTENNNLEFNWYRDVRSTTLEKSGTIHTDAIPENPPNYVKKPKDTASEHGFSSQNLPLRQNTLQTDTPIQPKELFGVDNIDINWLNNDEKPHIKRMISHRSTPLEIARHYEQPPPELSKTFRRATSTSEKVANLVKKYNK